MERQANTCRAQLASSPGTIRDYPNDTKTIFLDSSYFFNKVIGYNCTGEPLGQIVLNSESSPTNYILNWMQSLVAQN